MTVGEKFKVLREDCKMSLEEFSAKLGVSKEVLENWENNSVQPTNDEIQKVVDLVSAIREESKKSEEKVEEPVEEKPAENIEETVKEEAPTTSGKGPVLGTCLNCGKEVHKYDKYSQYKKHKENVFICDECDKERRKDPKFRRILRIINWLTYSTYLYIAVALCCTIIYFFDKHMELLYTDIALAFVILIQIVASYIIMRKHNV